MNENNEVFTVEEGLELSATQEVRKKLIASLTKSDSGIPEQNAEKSLLLGLLDGADRSTITRAKLRQEKKANENNTNAVKLVGEMLRSINAKTYRPPATDVERKIPDELATRDFVPGEMDIGNDPIQIGN